jgi:hypothetical protein
VTTGAQSPGQLAAVSPAWQTPSPHNPPGDGASVALQCWLHVTAMLGGGPINVNPSEAQAAGVVKLPFLTTGSQQQPIEVCADVKSGIASKITAIIAVKIIALRILLPVLVFLVSQTSHWCARFCLLQKQ